MGGGGSTHDMITFLKVKGQIHLSKFSRQQLENFVVPLKSLLLLGLSVKSLKTSLTVR